MRLFFALPLPASLQLEIDHWCTQSLPAQIERVPAKNYHLTLAFLGDVATSQLERLNQEADQILTSILLTQSDRSIHIDQIGYFTRAQIFWVGPSVWPENLTRLAQKLQLLGARLNCGKGGPKSRQPYQPHISLIRHCTDAITAPDRPRFTLMLEEVVLFESLQTRSGVHYQPIECWPLEQTLPQRFADRPALPRRPRQKH